MRRTLGIISKLSNKTGKDITWLSPAGFLLVLLFSYTLAQPFREIYGLEARNALIAREMLENGLGLIPNVLGRPYPDYPPLYFWLETIFSIPLGHVTPLSATLPSAISAVGLVALAFFIGRRISPVTGRLSALILATTPSFQLKASIACIDMLLAFTVAAAIFSLYLRDQDRRSKKKALYAVVAAIFMALAFLTKGPIGIVLPAVSWGGYLLWERRWKEAATFALFIFAVGIICVAIESALVYHAGGMHLINEVVRKQVAGRIGTQSNKPFFYYIICLLKIGSVWWLLIIVSSFRLRKTPLENQRRSLPRQLVSMHTVIRLMLTWSVGTLAVFTIASSKHARYLLPAYTAIAVIIAASVEHLLEKGSLPLSPVWGKSVNGVTVALLPAGVVFFFLYPKFIYVPFAYILIWFVTGIIGWLFVSRCIDKRYYLVGAILLFLFIGLSGANLMVTPAVSRRTSGQAFVKAAESHVDSSFPVWVYGINPDGDGIKYALHSNRKPSAIRFVDTTNALASITSSYLLITKLQADAGLQKLLSEKKHHPVAYGNIRSHQFAAYLMNVEGGPRYVPKNENK